MKKFMIYAVLIGIVSGITIYLLNSFGGGIDWNKALDFFAESWWGLIGIVSLLVSWFADSMVIRMLVNKSSDTKISVFQSFKTTIVGAFFSMITPSSSGGQPMQVVYMSKFGISPGVSTSVMVFRFIVEQGALEVIAIFGLAHAMRIILKIPAVASFAFLGFALSTAMIVFLILFSLNRKVYDKIFRLLRWLVGLLKFSKKLRPKIDGLLDRLDHEIKAYAESARIFSKSPFLLVSTFIWGVVSTLANIFLVYVAVASTGIFEHAIKGLLDVVSIQSLAMMIIYFSPTPGSSGVAEGGFYLFFSTLVSRNYLGTVTLEWRLLSYFLPLLIGFVLIIFESMHGMKNKKKEIPEGSDECPEEDSEGKKLDGDVNF